MDHPKIKDLKWIKTTWKHKNEQWIKTMVYNIRKGGAGMSLTKADKEWITSTIVTGVTEGIKPLSKKIDDLTDIVKKNHPDDFK